MNPYEDDRLADMPDGALSPGGLGLTIELLELGNVMPGARVLDVGCGMGASAGLLGSLDYITAGVDISAKLIIAAGARYPRVDFREADAARLPFEDSCFDAVMFECSLSLMDTGAALAEAHRVLRTGGVLLVSDVFAKNGAQAEDMSRILAMSVCDLPSFTDSLERLGITTTAVKDRSGALSDFYAQQIMSTGAPDLLLSREERVAIRELDPQYLLIAGEKR